MRPGRYSVIRYVHDTARDEAINIGVIVEVGGENVVRLDTDYERLLRREPEADVDLLKIWARDFALRVFGKRVPSLDELHTEHVNSIRFTEPRTVLVDDMHKTLNFLFGKLVAEKEAPQGVRYFQASSGVGAASRRTCQRC